MKIEIQILGSIQPRNPERAPSALIPSVPLLSGCSSAIVRGLQLVRICIRLPSIVRGLQLQQIVVRKQNVQNLGCNEPRTQQSEGSKKAAGTSQSKRVKKTEKVDEYIEEPQIMEDLWKWAFPVGTEWENLDAVYQFKWNFSNLEDAFKEGGLLHGKKVYLFACTEPQVVSFKGESKIIYIPAVVAHLGLRNTKGGGGAAIVVN